MSKKMWTSSRDELGRSSAERKVQFLKKPIIFKKILTEECGTIKGIELYIVDVAPLIVQILLYDYVVLNIFGNFHLAYISIQPFARNLAFKSVL